MFDFYEKRKLRDIFFSKPMAGFVFILALLLSYSAYGRYVAERETREKRLLRVEELQTLQQRAALLESKVLHIESERGMEDAIREQFDVAKEGEKVIVIVDPAASKTVEEKPQIFPLPPKPSLLERLKFW